MDWLNDHAWAGWLAAAIALGVVEMFSLDLVFLMLALGALGGVVATGLGAPFAVAAVVALGVAGASLLLVRPPLVKRLHGGPELMLGPARLVGQHGVVTQRMTGLESGRMKLSGEIWTAAPKDDEAVIEAGETVEVVEVRGATAYVRRVPPHEA